LEIFLRSITKKHFEIIKVLQKKNYKMKIVGITFAAVNALPESRFQ